MIDAERFWARVDKSGECWNWTGCSNTTGGYGIFWFNGTDRRAHRYSYIIHHPLTIDLLEHPDICVCHKCDNPRCVNPAHLFLGTMADNMMDKTAKGRNNSPKQKGEKNGNSKLTEDDVREIRTRYANGNLLQQQLALEYGVSRKAIGNVIRRKTWKHI